jgi:hypothetical protein
VATEHGADRFVRSFDAVNRCGDGADGRQSLTGSEPVIIGVTMASICTLTLNPAVDTSCQVDRVVPDRKLRCTRPTREPGGGGLNVARAIRILGGDAEAIWTRGGTTGQLLAELLDGEGVPHRPVPIEGLSRESLMVYETTTERQYRFQMPGPELDRRALDAVTDAVTGRQPVPEYLVLSGSLPPGAPDDFYARLAASVDPSVRVIVDTSGAALQRTVECGVFLIKPNVGELSALVDDPSKTTPRWRPPPAGSCEATGPRWSPCPSVPAEPWWSPAMDASTCAPRPCPSAAAWGPATAWWRARCSPSHAASAPRRR